MHYNVHENNESPGFPREREREIYIQTNIEMIQKYIFGELK